MEKIRSFDIAIKGPHENRYYVDKWIAGVIPLNEPLNVCKRCFAKCYNVGTSYLDSIIKAIKVTIRLGL